MAVAMQGIRRIGNNSAPMLVDAIASTGQHRVGDLLRDRRRSTAMCRALIAIISFVVLNRATESSLSEMVYRSA